jgi:hypothetical protein
MTFDAREVSTHDGAPLECYEITHGSTVWRLTSADSDVVCGGHTYTPATITRGEIDLSSEDGQSTLEIALPITHPIAALFIPDRPNHPVTLVLYAGHQDEAEWLIAWAGELKQPILKGSLATLTGMPAGRALRRTIPATSFQPDCNWPLFSPACGLTRNSHGHVATITGISGCYIAAADFGSHPNYYFRLGEVVGPDGETRSVWNHENTVITLREPFRNLAVGDLVTAYRGCSHTLAACAVFGNLTRFLGFPWVPGKNPFVSGVS